MLKAPSDYSPEACDAGMVSATECLSWVCSSDPRLSLDRSAFASPALNRLEIDMLQSRGSRHRAHWIMGRLAAKDAVRQYLSSRGKACPPAYEVTIMPGTTGAPAAILPDGSRLPLSIAHSAEIAVALSSDTAVGVDIERMLEHTPGMETLTLSAGEVQLLERVSCSDPSADAGVRSRWYLRFWTAKEALSKALGTGLGGWFLDFEIMSADTDILIVCHHPSRMIYRVHTFTLRCFTASTTGSTEYIAAWTGANHSNPFMGEAPIF